MSIQTLNGVTLETLNNYRAAARQSTTAYRLGSHRLVGAIKNVFASRVYPSTAHIAPRTTVRMEEVRGTISEAVAKSVDAIADRTAKAIDSSSNVATAQLIRISELTAGIENPLVASGLQSAARLALPGVKVALMVSSKVAEGARALAEATGARPMRKAARKAAAGAKRGAAPVVRKAKVVVHRAAGRA